MQFSAKYMTQFTMQFVFATRTTSIFTEQPEQYGDFPRLTMEA